MEYAHAPGRHRPAVLTDLSDMAVLVTGAGRGIGRAIAEAYAAAGAAVALVARTTAEIDAVAEEVRDGGGRAIALTADVADRSALEHAVRRTVDELGRLDFVVANAGIVAPEAPQSTMDDFAHVLNVNLLSVHALARTAEPHLRQRGGKFIVIGSGAGRRPMPGHGAYSVSKAGVAMLVRSLAVEWRDVPIAVNEIVPGPVRTVLSGGITDVPGLPPEVRRDWHKTPHDVVPLALFVAGLPDDGPTGQTFSLLGRDG